MPSFSFVSTAATTYISPLPLPAPLPTSRRPSTPKAMTLPARTPSTAATARSTSSDRKSTRLNSNHLGISYAVFFFCKYCGHHLHLPSSPTRPSSDLPPPLHAEGDDIAGSDAVDGGHGSLDIFRSEEHTSELQSLRHLLCRLFLL